MAVPRLHEHLRSGRIREQKICSTTAQVGIHLPACAGSNLIPMRCLLGADHTVQSAKPPHKDFRAGPYHPSHAQRVLQNVNHLAHLAALSAHPQTRPHGRRQVNIRAVQKAAHLHNAPIQANWLGHFAEPVAPKVLAGAELLSRSRFSSISGQGAHDYFAALAALVPAGTSVLRAPHLHLPCSHCAPLCVVLILKLFSVLQQWPALLVCWAAWSPLEPVRCALLCLC